MHGTSTNQPAEKRCSGLYPVFFVLIFLQLFSSFVILSDETNLSVSGESGDEGDIHWEITGSELHISARPGTDGEIDDFGYWDEPNWKDAKGYPWATTVYIHEGVTRIGDEAFWCHYYIQRVYLPSSLKSIGDHAFTGAKNLMDIIFLGTTYGIEEIGSGAFDLPNSGSIPERNYQFVLSNGNCLNGRFDDYIGRQLHDFSFIYQNFMEGKEGDNINWWIRGDTLTVNGTGEMGSYGDTGHPSWYGTPAWGQVKKVVIREGITSIGKSQFYLSTGIESISLPSTLTRINDNGFRECTKIKSIDIPNGVTFIGDSAFEGCTSLESMTFPQGIRSICDRSFYKCPQITVVNYAGTEDKIEYIGLQAFAFGNQDNPTHCDVYSMSNCLNGKFDKRIYDPVTDERCAVLDYHNSSSGTHGNVEWQIIGDTLYLTGSGKMDYADSPPWLSNTQMRCVTNVVVSDEFTSIGQRMLYGCGGVESVNIPSGIESIGEYAFSGCSSLADLTIPDGVKEIGNYAYSGTPISSLVIPDSVKTIGQNAFENCSSLQSVDIGDGVVSIGNQAFLKCASMESVRFGDHVESMGYMAFQGCYKLPSVVLPENLIAEEWSLVFLSCTSLKTVTIPSGISDPSIVASLFFVNDIETVYWNSPAFNESVLKVFNKALIIDANGGYVTGSHLYTEAKVFPYPDDFIPPENMCRFKEFNDSRDGGQTSYLPGDEHNFKAKRVFAIWERPQITFDVNDPELGSIDSSGPISVDQGTEILIDGNKLTIGGNVITATPRDPSGHYSYRFDRWDGVPRDHIVRSDMTITAVFVKVIDTIRFTVNDPAMGRVTRESLDNIDCGTLVTTLDDTVWINLLGINAEPKTDPTGQYTYVFDSWSGIPLDRILTEPVTITANFKKVLNLYTVSFTVNDPDWGTVGRTSIANVPWGSAFAVEGSKITIDGKYVTATPKAPTAQYSYGFLSWSGVPKTLTSDLTVTAYFQQTVNRYTVTFDSSGGSSVSPQTVEYGSKAVDPGTPVKSGKVFTGWYYDNKEWDFGTPVTGNITLVARWQSEVIVTFDVQGYGVAPPPQYLGKGDKIAEPADPSSDGRIFEGWFGESACITKWDFGTPVTSSFTLYAKWTAAECAVSSDERNWTLCHTLEEGLEACPEGGYMKLLAPREHPYVMFSKPVTVIFGSDTFISKNTSLTIASDVVFRGMLQMPISAVFAAGGCLTTDVEFELTATFTDPAQTQGRIFVKNLNTHDVSVSNPGYGAQETPDGLKLVKVTDYPYAVFAKGEFVFYPTIGEALANLPEDSGDVYVLNYIPLYEGGMQTFSYTADVSVEESILLMTVTRVTDGTHSSFYVKGKEIYNNGASIAIPEGREKAAELHGSIHVAGNCIMGIGDVSVVQNVALGGGKTGSDSDEPAIIRLVECASPATRMIVSFDNLGDWVEKKRTDEGWMYTIKEGYDYIFAISDRISLYDMVVIRTPGFEVEMTDGGYTGRLVASTVMIGYVKTSDGGFVGYTSITDAIGQAKETDGVVYILYRTTEKDGEEAIKSHTIYEDIVFDVSGIQTVHQHVAADGKTTYAVDHQVSKLVFTEGNRLIVRHDMDISMITIDGTIAIEGSYAVDLGGKWNYKTLTVDLSAHKAGVFARNVGDAEWNVTAYPGDGYSASKQGDDLVLTGPESGKGSVDIVWIAVGAVILALIVGGAVLYRLKH